MQHKENIVFHRLDIERHSGQGRLGTNFKVAVITIGYWGELVMFSSYLFLNLH
jgi:hypothetical protein